MKLTAKLGPVVQTVLRVLPYSFSVDETRETNLHAMARQVLGEQTRLMLRPSTAYGADAMEVPGSGRSAASGNTITVVLFNLSATPEQENHGAFLSALAAGTPGLTVLLDESGLLERGADPTRLRQRLLLWQEFCAIYKLPVSVVNLLDPGAHREEFERGLGQAGSREMP